MLSKRSSELTSIIDTEAKPLADRLSAAGYQAADQLRQAGEAVQVNADDAVAKIAMSTSQMTQQIQAVNEAAKSEAEITAHSIASSTDAMAEQFRAVNETAKSEAEITANSIASSTVAMVEQIRAVNHTVKSEAEITANSITSSTDAMAEQIRAVNQSARNEVESAASMMAVSTAEISEKLKIANETLSVDAAVVINRLSNTSDELKSLIASTEEGLGRLNNDISIQTENFGFAVEKAQTNLEKTNQLAAGASAALHQSTDGVIANMSAIADRFEQQGSALHSATRIIDAAQTNLESTLESKQESLEQLASSLVRRSDEIQNTMVSFSEMMGKLSEQSSEKTRSIGTAVTAEINAAIEESTNKFTSATQELKAAAKDVQKELEETRVQMRKGIIELPDETRENANAMRRVVTEQIAALKDLSAIVAKSGKSLDVAKPVEAQLKRATVPQGSNQYSAPGTPAPSVPRAIEQSQPTQGPAPGQSTPAGMQSAQIAPAARPVTTTAASPMATAVNTDQVPVPDPIPPQTSTLVKSGVQNSPTQPAYSPAKPAVNIDASLRDTTQQQSDGQDEESSGWVSNLLRRASEEDENETIVAPRPPAQPVQSDASTGQRSPLHVVESLNSLSMDIARAIDHEASIELWDRYQRGERNVFTRRLYTLNGQKTFDEIRNKYAREPEFRSAVDRYISDFEKLLADVSKNDRDNMMSQTYLTSDTGKVYTMLAHASGRFGSQ